MRIAVLDSYYPAVLDRLYASTPGLARRSYDEQLAAIMDLQFGTADAYSDGLQAVGHEAVDLILNATALQARWAAEHGLAPVLRRAAPVTPSLPGKVLEQRLWHEVAHAQLEQFDPDVIYLQDFWFFTIEELQRLRRPGRRIVGQLGSQPPGDGRMARCDLILTSFPHWVERVRAMGVPCEYFAIAFHEKVLSRPGVSGVARDIDVSFAGGIHSSDVHRAGTPLFERLCEEVGLQMWGYVRDQLRPDSPIHGNHHGEAWGLDMYRVLARSKIAINRHGDIAEDYANNMRLFEATGVGALLLTESARNLPGLFDPGSEIVTYDDVDDLVAKVRYYIAHEDERAAIAAAGQARTLRDHTYRRRMQQLGELLEARVG